VSETIALDLHLLRITAGPLRALFRLNTDIVGLVDAWGVRFVDELDYTREAANARQFSESVALTPLAGAVFAPEPLERLTSTRVLTTAWVEGNRLDALVSEDEALRRKRVAALCGVAMNAYRSRAEAIFDGTSSETSPRPPLSGITRPLPGT